MRIQIFTVPVSDPTACDDLNRFLAGHRVLNTHREFIQNGSASCWTFCVEYLIDAHEGNASQRGRQPRVDYKEVLLPAQFAVFSRLRECRKKLAADEGLPAFAVFTDEQLAAMSKLDTLTETSMRQIEGIGDGKSTKYAKAFVAAHVDMGASQ